jgi:hypothetical protein
MTEAKKKAKVAIESQFFHKLNELVEITNDAIADKKEYLVEKGVYYENNKGVKGEPKDFLEGNNPEWNKIANEGKICSNEGLGLENIDAENKCMDYINLCIRDGTPDNIKKCREDFLSNKDLWKYDGEVKKSIEKMYPDLMLRTLHGFGFKKYKNTKKGNLFYIISTEQWLEDIKAELSSDLPRFKAIKDNTALLNYIKLIRDRVNENPIILNPEYKAPSTSIQSVAQDLPRGFHTLLSVIKPGDIFGRTQATKSDLIFRWPDIKKKYDQVITNIAPIRPFGLGLYTQRGGSAVEESNKIFEFLEEIEQMPSLPSKFIKTEFDAILNNFKAKKIVLDPTEQQTITDLIHEYSKTEKKLWTSIYILKEFKNRAIANGLGNNPITLDYIIAELQKTKSQINKITNKGDVLVEIMSLISNAQKQLDNKSTSGKTSGFDIKAEPIY